MGRRFPQRASCPAHGEDEGYYRAFADKPLEHLARSLTEGFAYQGEVFPLHEAPRGEPSAHLPPEATIFFAQNHDQVGNRAFGERLSRLVSPDKLKLALALVLLSPHIPMLFMGEEAAAETPFLFFADWTGEACRIDAGRPAQGVFALQGVRDPRNAGQDTGPLRRNDISGLQAGLDEHRPIPFGREVSSADGAALDDPAREDRALDQEVGSFRAQRQLLGADPRMGGVDVRWQTESGDVLQIVANFAGHELPMPALVDGESLWRLRPDVAGGLASGDMIVRLGQKG